MLTFVSIGGVALGAAILERRFQNEGNVRAADQAKWFGRFFLIGSGGYVVYCWIVAAVALIAL
ncbi:hypothetical protein D3C71_2242540 [compost metagenome]